MYHQILGRLFRNTFLKERLKDSFTLSRVKVYQGNSTLESAFYVYIKI